MSYLPAELIKKKRRGLEHSEEEILFLVREYTKGSLPDYQMSAWLMAVCFQGLTDKETSSLTEAMMRSGDVFDFSHLSSLAVDKHSTGGIGDKTSLILAPLAACAGVPVPMMAGRGLGHTGGTLDKLEAIPGFQVQLDTVTFQKQIQKLGVAIIGQTKNICPADLQLYALRDVTATVDSIPLICASIMSKKLAEGVGALVLDVKFGSGAFMKTLQQAKDLAQKLVQIGHLRGRKMVALVTNMNQPLGRWVGNACEVRECLELMNGSAEPQDTLELTLELASHMLVLGKKAPSLAEAKAKCLQLMRSGAVLEKFLDICQAQGATPNWKLPEAQNQSYFLADQDGILQPFDVELIGYAAIELGAGRRQSQDTIDHTAGMEFLKKPGDKVKKGEPLLRYFAQDSSRFPAAKTRLSQALSIGKQAVAREPLIAAVVTPFAEGDSRAAL